MNDRTGQLYGVMEVLVATALNSAFYALFTGQPLIIIGVTAPVSVFSVTCYTIALGLKLPFLALLFWYASLSC